MLGHAVPLGERMGGWLVTGHRQLEEPPGQCHGSSCMPESSLPPRWTSGKPSISTAIPPPPVIWLAHLLHEHQAGFITIALEAGYRARAALHEGGGIRARRARGGTDAAADKLAAYLLFADETALPPGGVAGDAQFRQDFAATRRPMPPGVPCATWS